MEGRVWAEFSMIFVSDRAFDDWKTGYAEPSSAVQLTRPQVADIGT